MATPSGPASTSAKTLFPTDGSIQGHRSAVRRASVCRHASGKTKGTPACQGRPLPETHRRGLPSQCRPSGRQGPLRGRRLDIEAQRRHEQSSEADVTAKGQAHTLTRLLTGCRHLQLAIRAHQRRGGPPPVDYVRQRAIRTSRWPKAPLVRRTEPILPSRSRHLPEDKLAARADLANSCRRRLPDRGERSPTGRPAGRAPSSASVAQHPSEVACQPREAKAAQK